jgi:aldehyde dehydrogenase (NAD+)
VENIHQIITSQEEFFASGKTLSIEFRIQCLKKLDAALAAKEETILLALKKDLGKGPFEGFMSELGLLRSEIKFLCQNLRKWAAPKSTSTPFYCHPGSSKVYSVPKGKVLILAPWNYPLNLSLVPLVGAIAAGNTVVLRPSSQTKNTGKIIEDLVSQCFEPHHAYVTCMSTSETNEYLLNRHWDHLFFTGSVKVAKLVTQRIAPFLTPFTLELGGKSPCIVDKNCDLPSAAKRILWAKTLNSGQTCVAPDYLIIHESIKEQFFTQIKKAMLESFPQGALNARDYSHIINQGEYERLVSYLDQGKVILGGKVNPDSRQIEPTFIEDFAEDSDLDTTEIFGPIMPVKTFRSHQDLKAIISKNSHPLALYLFTKDETLKEFIVSQIPFGGGCINDCLMHIGIHSLPFGGIGNSGIGHYHGEHSFNLFSHQKSIYSRTLAWEPALRFRPFKDHLIKYLKLFLRI